jgi:phage/plasmid-like protein (TIGR03299 family)
MSNRIEQVLNETGLNWTVREESMVTASGIVIPDRKALIREDNNEVLSVHGDGYQAYQNYQLVELLDRVSAQVGLPIHSGGLFGEGKKVFIQLKSNDLTLGSDKVVGYITGINSFDGSTSLAFGPSNLTISCQNTFFSVFRTLENKIKHTKNMELRIDDVCKGMENAVKEEAKMFETIKRMFETEFGAKERDYVTKTLFNVNENVNLMEIDAVSTTTRNRITTFEHDLLRELKEKGNTLWGLFSGVTRYTTHSLGKGDSTENKMFGTYGNREREIFRELSELVGG